VYEWIRNDARNPYATLYITNITLNRSAIELLDNPSQVMLGVNKEAKEIAIRPVTPQEIDDLNITNEELYKISIGKSYGRIANKGFCMLICELFDITLTAEAGRKFPITYKDAENLLIIELARGEIS